MFSEKFEVSKEKLEKYGALDISLIADVPMFIDPILIFNSDKEIYKRLHKNIIKYMYFLADKASEQLDDKEITTWFTFKEVCNNWLGFSMSGNKGQALNLDFGKKLYKNISFVVNNSNISTGLHSEKIMLIYPGSGKDKISDMTVNLIKGFLCEYTQRFTKENVKKNVEKFYVEKAEFNYLTKTFCSKPYLLPYIINEKGKKEYILLTPKDILRFDEPAINRTDFLNNLDNVRSSIDNNDLRTQLNGYLQDSIIEYHKKCEMLHINPNEAQENKIKKDAFENFSFEHKEIYDYYIKIKELQKIETEQQACSEVELQTKKFEVNVKYMIKQIELNYSSSSTFSFEEAKKRVEFFKHRIECNDCNKLFYVEDGNKIIKNENDLQRMFKFVWYGSKFKDDSETNNGRGPADFVISFGSNDVTVIEFKLAKNTNLNHVFEQVKIYDNANKTSNDIVVIFYFNDKEYKKATDALNKEGKSQCLNENIYLIDCKLKESASRPNAIA
jgi:hypothetical protein